MTYDHWKTKSPDDDQYYDSAMDDEYCPECGGEGFVYSCQDEIGCIDPDAGCDLCKRRCDWCNPKKKKAADQGEA